MNRQAQETDREKWTRFRFSVVGPLLAAPPARGELRAELEKLTQKTWRHPVTGLPARFGLATIERWYYTAKNARDPIEKLRRRVRKDAGSRKGLSLDLRQTLREQYREHPGWSVRLHYDNMAALLGERPGLGPLPSYETVRRWMRSQDMLKRRRRRGSESSGQQRARRRLERLEVRSYEVEHVGGLWHADFHAGSRKVLLRSGEWASAHLLGVLDDRSRLACHLQWYLDETAETFVHGLCQAVQKRGLPRALMTDNGSAMTAEETREGLHRLGILHEPTLPYSPYQNGKQEVLWASVEGRLISMLEGVEELTLDLLNEATQAWAEMEYNRKHHSEIGMTPLQRHLHDSSLLRESPSSEALRRAFRIRATRTQRRSDGTITVEGVRFEIPSRFRSLTRAVIAYARWDLSSVDLIDSRTGEILCALYPLDKTKNAQGERRALAPIGEEPILPQPGPGGMAALLKKLMAEYAATGLPPAYLPKSEPETGHLFDKEETS